MQKEKDYLGSDFMLDSWVREGESREDFEKTLEAQWKATSYDVVDVSDLGIGYISDDVPGYDHRAFRGLVYRGGLRGRHYTASLSKAYLVKMLKKTNTDRRFIGDIRTNKEILEYGGATLFASARAITDLTKLAKLSGVGFEEPCEERVILLSRALAKAEKEVCLVVRKRSCEKVVAVRNAKFQPIPQETVQNVLDVLDEEGGKEMEDSYLEWHIDHKNYEGCVVLPKFAYSMRTTYGLDELQPFILFRDSTIGESSFCYATGVTIGGNRIIFNERTWSHNMKTDAAIRQIVAVAKDNLLDDLTEHLEYIKGISIRVYLKSNQERDELLDFIYKEGDFEKTLGVGMWNDAKEAVKDLIKSRTNRKVSGVEILTEIYRACGTKRPPQQRAMATIPKSFQKWLQQNGIFPQMNFAVFSAQPKTLNAVG